MSVSNLNSQTLYCKIEDHQENPLNLVCTKRNCPQRGLLCSYCLLRNHNDHVNQCIPLRDLIKAVNKANSPLQQEQLYKIGNQIIKEHEKIIFEFKKSVKELKVRITDLEQIIEEQMKKMKQEAQFFVSQQLEKSLEIINQENVTAEQLNQEFFKIYPVLKVENQKVSVFSEAEKQLEADRIMKMTDLLEREVHFYMQKSLKQMEQINTSIQRASTKKVAPYLSENRFGLTLEGWEYSNIDAITFQPIYPKEQWLRGFGLYKIIDIKDDLQIDVKIYEGKSIKGRNVLHQILKKTNLQDENSSSQMIQILLNSAIKIKPKHQYTISIQSNQKCLSYFGANGSEKTNDFIFFDTEFDDKNKSNSTTTNAGLFPYFYMEK
ncbi:hypothetical protein PPERSA_02128 [Pseudocohnilembus persalinus]|uniref:PHR domain-containing protein n=1 Tax=Pseudocohnilembus persalinus TaxID=266149 RepID=A0A0V0Q859_PSEPJ|nr:hypothetical protein PPERSA_02128 [Pseudocohnilembus persalinus]|eukprot:KRW98351.1 hypothetical protein PPERSA_02128 [Pseudocohnilembus persalinus]